MLVGEIMSALESIENALEMDQSNPDAWMLHARLLAAEKATPQRQFKAYDEPLHSENMEFF